MTAAVPLQVTLESLRFGAIVLTLSLGVFFTFVSTVGVLRLPDIYARAHTASQTDTLGAGFALAAVALAFGWQHATIYTVLLLFFVFLTNPTAAHAIARSAAETGVEPLLAEGGSGDDPAGDSDGDATTDGSNGAATDGGDGAATDGTTDGGDGAATDGGDPDSEFDADPTADGGASR